ncbi:MAG TPA: GMC family oxidoreductase [Myxococcota bacterium]|nr:GMC family oxidoreductase [Myxococcota bacterium]
MVGSGPGGAILARKLAAKGRSVVLVEVGPVVRRADYVKEAGYTLSRYFWNGGLRTTRGNIFMPTMQARCLGGGSVFNSAICLRTPEFALKRWEYEHGVRGMTRAELDPHFDEVERFMGVRPVAPEIQGRRNELFRRACEAMGFRADAIVRNEKGCKGSGECLTGCPNGAKMSLDLRGVPEVLEGGGRVYTSIEAAELILEGRGVGANGGNGNGKSGNGHGATGAGAGTGAARRGHSVRGITGWAVEPFTGRRTHKVRITARCTVLAAGALASPVIMMQSGIRRAPVGANLRFHPGTAVMGIFDDEVAPWSGATQGYHCLDFLEQGMKFESLWAIESLLAFRFPGMAEDFKDLLKQYRYMASWDVFVSGEDSAGRIRTLPGARPDIQYHLGEGDVRRLQEGMAKLIEMFFAVGARRVLSGVHGMPPQMTDVTGAGLMRQATLSVSDIPCGSNHVFGTTAMGEDPERHVIDSSGAAHEVDNLYVCDTGVLPASPAVNPMLTIMAIADKMGETLAARY